MEETVVPQASTTPAPEATTASIAAVLGGLLSSIEAGDEPGYRQIAGNPAVQRAVQAVKDYRPEDFYFTLLYPLDRILDAVLNATIPGNREAAFLLKHGQFIEAHLTRIVTMRETRTCSHDKVRTIMQALLHHFLTGREIAFNYAGEYTFHLPKTYFRTHAQIVTFFDAVRSLYYGDPTKYVLALKEIVDVPVANGDQTQGN